MNLYRLCVYNITGSNWSNTPNSGPRTRNANNARSTVNANYGSHSCSPRTRVLLVGDRDDF